MLKRKAIFLFSLTKTQKRYILYLERDIKYFFDIFKKMYASKKNNILEIFMKKKMGIPLSYEEKKIYNSLDKEEKDIIITTLINPLFFDAVNEIMDNIINSKNFTVTEYVNINEEKTALEKIRKNKTIRKD